jgi:hypothetical protein
MDALFPFIQRASEEAAALDTAADGITNDGSQILATAVLYYILDALGAARVSQEALQKLLEAANIWIGTRGALLFPEHGERLLAEAKSFCEDYASAEREKTGTGDLEAMNGIWDFVRKNQVTDPKALFDSVAVKNERFALSYNVVLVLMAQGKYSGKAFARFLKRRKTVPDAPLLDYARMLYREMYPRAPVSVVTAAVDGLAGEFAALEGEYKSKLAARAEEEAQRKRTVREERIRDHLQMMAKRV